MFHIVQNILCFNYIAHVHSTSPFEITLFLIILDLLQTKLLNILPEGEHKYLARAKAVTNIMPKTNMQYLKHLKLFVVLHFLQIL